MEGFTYSDIFATKGVEYIVIIVFLTLLIPFTILLNRRFRISGQLREALGSITSGALRIPQGLFFGRNHTWMFMERSGVAKVGLDDLLLHLTGNVKIKHLHPSGEIVHKGDLLTELEQEGKVLKIFSPVSGRIVDRNELINEDPGIMHDDPYGKGWIYKIKPTNWKMETRSCFLAEEASNWSENELTRFKDFLGGVMTGNPADAGRVVLQDGGELRDHTLAALPPDVWEGFQKEFLTLYQG